MTATLLFYPGYSQRKTTISSACQVVLLSLKNTTKQFSWT